MRSIFIIFAVLLTAAACDIIHPTFKQCDTVGSEFLETTSLDLSDTPHQGELLHIGYHATANVSDKVISDVKLTFLFRNAPLINEKRSVHIGLRKGIDIDYHMDYQVKKIYPVGDYLAQIRLYVNGLNGTEVQCVQFVVTLLPGSRKFVVTKKL